MNVQIKQIRSDIVELLFNPHEEDLRVGENLTLREKGSDRGLIVQIIEFRTITYPSLLHEMMEMLAEETETPDMPEMPDLGDIKLPPGVELPGGGAPGQGGGLGGMMMMGKPQRKLEVRLWSPGIAPDGATASLNVSRMLVSGPPSAATVLWRRRSERRWRESVVPSSHSTFQASGRKGFRAAKG